MILRWAFVMLLILVAVCPGIATAESEIAGNLTNEITDDTQPNQEQPPVEAIDNRTGIESVRIDGDEMTLVIRSDIHQRIVLMDAGAFWEGGEVSRQRVTLRPGRNRISLVVTEVSGRITVVISTSATTYAKTVSTRPPLIGGPYDEQDVQTAGIAGLVTGVGLTGLIAYRRVRGASRSPERML